MAAGFDPVAFWQITPRLFDLHMRGATKRLQREAEIENRSAYNTAALTGGAMAGRLPRYESVFRQPLRAGARQSSEVLEANLRALAKAWGATSS